MGGCEWVWSNRYICTFVFRACVLLACIRMYIHMYTIGMVCICVCILYVGIVCICVYVYYRHGMYMLLNINYALFVV